jgi:hypothetical protein
MVSFLTFGKDGNAWVSKSPGFFEFGSTEPKRINRDYVLVIGNLGEENILSDAPVILDSGFYEKSKDLWCPPDRKRYLLRGFEFSHSNVVIYESKSGEDVFVEIGSFSPVPEILNRVVVAACLRKNPKVFYLWASGSSI